jgi:hypothetical protein
MNTPSTEELVKAANLGLVTALFAHGKSEKEVGALHTKLANIQQGQVKRAATIAEGILGRPSKVFAS